MGRVVLVACVATLTFGAGVSAQTGSSGAAGQTSPGATQTATPAPDETRPATTTFYGDTGLWFVPTAEVLAHKKWSASGYRRGTNYEQGFANIGDFAGTFAVGIKNRAEVFGSFLVDTRVERDLRPIFLPTDATVGGIVDRYPRVNSGWTGNHVGDLYVGAKVNFWSEYAQKPAALAVRVIFMRRRATRTWGRRRGRPILRST
jgi:hypothetical protein